MPTYLHKNIHMGFLGLFINGENGEKCEIFSNTVMNLNYEMFETRVGSVYPGLRCVVGDFKLSLQWKLILVFLVEI